MLVPTKSSALNYSRGPTPSPPKVADIQVNFCRNPGCIQFRLPPADQHPAYGQAGAAAYTGGTGKPGKPKLVCSACGRGFVVKSNLAVHEEFMRIGAYLEPEPPAQPASCPSSACANHAVPLDVAADAASLGPYRHHGRTKSGTPRYRCGACGRTFVAKRRSRKRPTSHEDREVLDKYYNGMVARRIAKTTGVNIETVYRKLAAFHRQALLFAAHRERTFPTLTVKRLYLCTDRQDYTINWSDRRDRRNVKFTAVGTADLATGYVFAMNLNFDPSLDRSAVEQEADALGDFQQPAPFRRHARVWFLSDYEAAAMKPKKARRDERVPLPVGVDDSGKDLLKRVEEQALDAEKADDREEIPEATGDTQLPDTGMQIHAEYTLAGHFHLLQGMFQNVGKVRFYLDQDPGIFGAWMGAFAERADIGTADAFFVRITKGMIDPERTTEAKRAWSRFREYARAHPQMDTGDLRLRIIIDQFPAPQEIGNERQRWLVHPLPTKNEPEKAVCFLTDRGQYTVEEQLARLYDRASLHAIDNFFQETRRSVSILERPIGTPSAGGRTWLGRSAYNPGMVGQALETFRVVYNFCHVGEDNKTPAMRLGLAHGKLSIEDILYWTPTKRQRVFKKVLPRYLRPPKGPGLAPEQLADAAIKLLNRAKTRTRKLRPKALPPRSVPASPAPQ
jgi:transposase-like protein